jgi:hypothetical protein
MAGISPPCFSKSGSVIYPLFDLAAMPGKILLFAEKPLK